MASGLTAAQLSAIKQRNTVNGQLDERAYFYDKQSASNASKSGGTPVIPQNTNLNISGFKQATGGNSGSSSKSSSDSLSTQQDKLRKSLGKSFGSTIDAYKNMIGWLPEEQGNLETQVNQLADTQKNSVNNALNTSLEKFTGYRDEVGVNQKRTLQDLSDNTRNLFQAGNNYLGARGAGNSSATGMYSAALTQQANKERTGVQRQSNDMYNDINMQEKDVQGQAQQQLDAIETWKATRVSEIVQQYQDLKRQLTLAKAQADDSKKAALAKLDASLFNSAISKLNDLQSTATQYKSQVSGLMQDQNGELSGILGGINNASQYDVQEQQVGELDGIEGEMQQQADGSYIGMFNGRKTKFDEQGNPIEYLE